MPFVPDKPPDVPGTAKPHVFQPSKLTDSTGGTAGSTLVVTAPQQLLMIPVQLADLVNSAVWTLAIPFAFTVLSALFRTGKPGAGSSAAATLTLSTSGGAVTGGVMATTLANQNTTGGAVAASAISGANATVVAGGTIIITPTSVTVFTAGDGWVEIVVSNNDLANTISSLAAQIGKIQDSVQR